MNTKRIKEISIFGSIVAFLAIFMFAFVTFAGENNEVVKSKNAGEASVNAEQMTLSFIVTSTGGGKLDYEY